MTRDQKIAALKTVQGSPIWLHSDEQASSTRLRLLVAGSVAIIVSCLEIRIGADPTLFGLQLVGLSDQLIRWLLAAMVLYLWVHLAWYCWEAWQEFRLRLSGAKSQRHPDFLHDPSLTLYGWWLLQDKDVGMALKVAPDLIRLSQHQELNVAHNNPRLLPEDQQMLEKGYREITFTLKEMQKLALSPHIGEALKRFDWAFSLLVSSQNLRWLFFDAGLPLAIGALGFALVAKSAFESSKPILTFGTL